MYFVSVKWLRAFKLGERWERNGDIYQHMDSQA